MIPLSFVKSPNPKLAVQKCVVCSVGQLFCLYLSQLEEEEDELEDKFDISVSVKDPEKIGEPPPSVLRYTCIHLGHCNMSLNQLSFSGDGMNAYMAYKVTTQVMTCCYPALT